MSSPRKEEIITFKVDESLSNAMKGIENRSEFIRVAILEALENTCPLCMGTGTLSPTQREHWENFANKHTIAECDECLTVHLVCEENRLKE